MSLHYCFLLARIIDTTYGRPEVKWAALALGIISLLAVVRSAYVLAQDIRTGTGIGGGAVRLPPDEEHMPDAINP